MTLGDIIKKYRLDHDLSMDGFALRSGISKAYISLLEKNRHPKSGKPIAPSIQCIKQCADAMGMSFDSLLAKLDGQVSLQEDAPVASYPGYTSVPLYASVSAGTGTLASDNIESYIPVPDRLAKYHKFFALRVKGDSMEPDIKNGDIVLVKENPEPENNKVVVALVNGDEGFCKRLIKYAHALALVSNNQAYEPMVFTSEEVETKPVRILGTVEGLIRYDE